MICSLGLSTCAVLAAPNQETALLAQDAARKAAQSGPIQIKIDDQAEISIPKNFAFIPQQQAQALLSSWGNSTDPKLKGLVVATGKQATTDSVFVVEYAKEGYIKDADAKDLNADDILSTFKEGTENGNEERIKKGFSAIEVTGWSAPPEYNKDLHRLTWALVLHEKNATTTDADTVNYETRLLGRDGFVSVTMLAAPKDVAKDKAIADDLSSKVHYVAGKQYSDYSASAGDKLAEYGLVALITGAVAKKVGLLGMIGVFLLKSWKLIAIAVFSFGAAFKRLFKRNTDQ